MTFRGGSPFRRMSNVVASEDVRRRLRARVAATNWLRVALELGTTDVTLMTLASGGPLRAVTVDRVVRELVALEERKPLP